LAISVIIVVWWGGADRYGASEHQSSRMEKEEAEDAFISLHA